MLLEMMFKASGMHTAIIVYSKEILTEWIKTKDIRGWLGWRQLNQQFNGVFCAIGDPGQIKSAFDMHVIQKEQHACSSERRQHQSSAGLQGLQHMAC